MSAQSATLRARRRAERDMIDTCTIDRPGATTTDPGTGDVTDTSTRIYPTPAQIIAGNPGRCEVQSRNTMTSNPEAGGHTFTVVSRVVKIPANSADIRDGDVVTITASRLNAFTVGKQYRVSGFEPDSFDTAFRLPVKIL